MKRGGVLIAGVVGIGLSHAAISGQTRMVAQDRTADVKEAAAAATTVKPPRRDDAVAASEEAEAAAEAVQGTAVTPDRPPREEVEPQTETPPIEQPAPVVEEERPAEDERPIIMRNADLPLYENGEVLLFLNDGAIPTGVSGIEVVSQQEIEPIDVTMVEARITSGESVRDAVARLERLQQFAWVQPNYIYQLLGNSRSRGLSMHGLEEGASLLPQGLPPVASGAKIAMIDSAVDVSHESLSGARISQVGRYAKAPPTPHGTAISEILVGTGEFPGIVTGAQLLSIPAFMPMRPEDWHAPSISTTKRLVEALELAHDAEPDVLNLSFGSPTSTDPAIRRMIETLFGSGVCIAAAAGNAVEDPVMFPATLTDTIAVAAVDLSERVYKDGSRGEAIDIASWGVSINAAVPGGRRPVTGTSFAAPIVAGAMLRMPMCNQYANPAALRDALAQDAKDLGVPGKDEVFGAGLLRFGEAAATDGKVSPGGTGLEGNGTAYWIGGGLAVLTGFLFLLFRRRRSKNEPPN